LNLPNAGKVNPKKSPTAIPAPAATATTIASDPTYYPIENFDVDIVK